MNAHLLGTGMITSAAAPLSAPEGVATPATGTVSLAWLLLLLPVIGAVVLLVGGRRLDRVGHIIGCARYFGSQRFTLVFKAGR